MVAVHTPQTRPASQRLSLFAGRSHYGVGFDTEPAGDLTYRICIERHSPLDGSFQESGTLIKASHK